MNDQQLKTKWFWWFYLKKKEKQYFLFFRRQIMLLRLNDLAKGIFWGLHHNYYPTTTTKIFIFFCQKKNSHDLCFFQKVILANVYKYT